MVITFSVCLMSLRLSSRFSPGARYAA
ncbi:hypothetical protein QIH97_gp02 [Enterobacter phage KNP3]|nr:hypothetical protein QIH97_gp02 [Enterobacter phage KNP3]